MLEAELGRPERRRRFILVLAFALLVVGQALFAGYNYYRSDISGKQPLANAETQLASEALEELEIKERLPRDGYSRTQFSQGWGVVAGCDMRNRILQRDLDDVVLDDDNCTVLSGVLTEDPFTGQTIPFQRGRDTSGAIHIEHLVAVSDAWQKGAQDITYEERWQFFNDPLNLVAVDGPANMQKGDSDAAGWLPRQEYRCRYIARQIAVKVKYALWVTRLEYETMKRVLFRCPNQLLPIEKEVAAP